MSFIKDYKHPTKKNELFLRYKMVRSDLVKRHNRFCCRQSEKGMTTVLLKKYMFL